MNFKMLKKFLINNSSNGNKFKMLIFENSIHNFKNFNDMLNDYDYLNSIFCTVIYCNFPSRCKKKQSINTRLNNVKEIESHQITSEFEKFQRVDYYLDKIVFFLLIINFIILINIITQ